MGEVHKLEFKDEAEKRKEARGYSALIFFHTFVIARFTHYLFLDCAQ